jgi:hypothetical protein
MTGCIKMYHGIETLIKWVRGNYTSTLEDILGGVALFATFAAILFIGYGVGL